MSSANVSFRLGDVFVVRAPELQKGIGLAHLPRALQHQGLAFPALFPRFKIIHDFAVHPLSPFHADFSIAQIRVKINLFLMRFRIILREYF